MTWIDISDSQDGSCFINLALVRSVVSRGDEVSVAFGPDYEREWMTARGEAAHRLRYVLGVLAESAALYRASLPEGEKR